jgi:FkbM family methyltransferase
VIFARLIKRLRIRAMKHFGLPARRVGGVWLYSQGMEDMYLLRIFGRTHRGFYVDVGANDGTFVSNTHALYRQGWRGICIEPNPAAYAVLKARRPDDVCLNLAVGNSDGVVELSWSGEITEGSAVRTPSSGGRSARVEQTTLAQILSAKHAPANIDLLTIDVEGMEYQVLEGLDWQLHRPRIVIVEYNSESKVNYDAFDLLMQHGYRPVLINRWNVFMSLHWREDLLKVHRRQDWFGLDAPGI